MVEYPSPPSRALSAAKHEQHTPVWSPTPGVPLAARILAYAFGALMLVTVLHDIFGAHSPDVIPLPATNEWTHFKTSVGCTIWYPKDWLYGKRDKQNTEISNIEFRSKMGEQFVIISQQVNAQLTSEMYPTITQKIEEQMSGSIKGYTPGDVLHTDGGDIHRFSFFDSDNSRALPFGRKIPYTGAWAFAASDHGLVQMVALAPEQSWPNMENIFTNMVKYARFDQ